MRSHVLKVFVDFGLKRKLCTMISTEC